MALIMTDHDWVLAAGEAGTIAHGTQHTPHTRHTAHCILCTLHSSHFGARWTQNGLKLFEHPKRSGTTLDKEDFDQFRPFDCFSRNGPFPTVFGSVGTGKVVKRPLGRASLGSLLATHAFQHSVEPFPVPSWPFSRVVGCWNARRWVENGSKRLKQLA